MRFLKEGDKACVKSIDASVKNKWSWKWIDHELSFDLGKYGEVKYKLGDCISKIDISGTAWCTWCEDKLGYGGNGKTNLLKHCSTTKHIEQLKTRAGNFRLSSSYSYDKESTTSSESSVNSSFSNFKNVVAAPSVIVGSGSTACPSSADTSSVSSSGLIPYSDRSTHVEALILAWLAEHSLPMSKADSLCELIKEASRDPKSLNDLNLSKQIALNKLNHGLAKTVKHDIVKKLKCVPFSLNTDEATNDHGKKVLSLIVSYFDDESGEILVNHLASVELVRTDAKSIFNAIVGVIESNKIPWTNLVSALLDSCNVMRGKKSGVETLLRKKAPHLLDIDGDTCHHLHNVAKALCEPFQEWSEAQKKNTHYLEKLFTDLFTDFRYCTQYKDIMSEICRIAKVNFTVPQRFTPHRWLSAYDLSVETSRLFDIYVIFYSAFLPVTLKGQYRPLVDALIQKFETHQARERIRDLLSILGAKKQTPKCKKRKERIMDYLFIQQEKTLLQLTFYQASLFSFKMFVLRYQKKEPLIHMLHTDQLSLARNFLVKFVKASFIRGHTATSLKSLQLSEEMFMDDGEIFLGVDTREIFSSANADTQETFLKSVRKGFLEAGKLLLNKLPLDNTHLISLKYINPDRRSDTGALSHLQNLATMFDNVLTFNEKALVDEEIRSFIIEDSFKPLKDGRIDHWWENSNFHLFKRIIKAALSSFHGPQVESSFSLMKGIMKKNSGRMSVNTFDSVQTVKYYLMSKNTSAVKFFHRPSINHSPVDKNLIRNMQSATKTYTAQLEMNRSSLDEEMGALKMKRVKIQTAALARRIKEKALSRSIKRHVKTVMKRKHVNKSSQPAKRTKIVVQPAVSSTQSVSSAKSKIAVSARKQVHSKSVTTQNPAPVIRPPSSKMMESEPLFSKPVLLKSSTQPSSFKNSQIPLSASKQVPSKNVKSVKPQNPAPVIKPPSSKMMESEPLFSKPVLLKSSTQPSSFKNSQIPLSASKQVPSKNVKSVKPQNPAPVIKPPSSKKMKSQSTKQPLLKTFFFAAAGSSVAKK